MFQASSLKHYSSFFKDELFLLIHLFFFRGKKVQIAGHAATTGGPDNERSEIHFL